MKFKKILIILLFTILILGIIYFVITHIHKKEDTTLSEYTPQEEISDNQLKQTIVTLYFIENGNNSLKPEGRIVSVNTLLQDPYKELSQLLLDGPKTSGLSKIIPDNTRILETTLNNSCVTLNFSQEILNFNDDTQKYNIINSLLNTLTQLNEVNSIKILVNGEPNDIFNEEYSLKK